MPHIITQAWIAISRDENGDEGIVAYHDDGEWRPLVATRQHRLPALMEDAARTANRTGRVITIVEFNSRTDLQTFQQRKEPQ